MTDKEFLDNYDVNNYERPSLTTDVVIFTVEDGKLKVLLTQRDQPPFFGYWALPGGFLDLKKSLLQNARDVLYRKSGLQEAYLEQLFTEGDVDRDPRTRVIDVVYFALVPVDKIAKKCILNTGVLEVDKILNGEIKLAFDHKKIIRCAVDRIRGKLNYTPIAFSLVNSTEAFTIGEVQKVYEAILGKKLVRMNFRRDFLKKYFDTGLIEEARGTSNRFSKRPGKLYRIKTNKTIL